VSGADGVPRKSSSGNDLFIQGDSIVKKVCIPSTLVLVLAALSLSILRAEVDTKQETKPDADVLAKKLITKCARVKDGDLVQISGGVRDVELLESLTVEAAKLGADTLLNLSVGDRTSRRLYTDVPARFDSRTSPLGMKLAEAVTVMIGVDSTESEAVLADIPAQRLSARAEARVTITEKTLKRNVRQVYLGNGLYPTETRAKQYGITKTELGRLFYEGLNVDYDKMQVTGEAVRKALVGGKKVHITTPAGTDLTVEIASRRSFVSDGVLSDDKLKRGGAACQTWLPAGEVYLTPVPGTAEGKVLVERMLLEGKEIHGLSLTFKKGKLMEMKAKSGLERLQALYDAGSAGKDEFSFLDLGINPAVHLPKNSPTGLFMEAGTITVGCGSNVWAGGDNKSSFDLTCYLRGGMLQIDGKALVEDGNLQTPR
jgi:aminopeptidase